MSHSNLLPYFYKILMRLTDKLRLPEEFTNKYGEILPENAKLRIASGSTWDMRVEESDYEEGLFFTRGWTEFSQDMQLDMFELLVFSYVGNSTFNVTVYATSGFEKESNYRVVKNPQFQCRMKDYNHRKVNVRSEFVEASGLKEKRRVWIEYGGGQREEVGVSSLKRNGTVMHWFGPGWANFWKGNRLTVGTSYSFEFIPTENVIRVEPVPSSSA